MIFSPRNQRSKVVNLHRAQPGGPSGDEGRPFSLIGWDNYEVVFIYLLRYRLDQGHLYPLGERHAGQHVTGGAGTSAPLHRRRPLYLKSYLVSLYAGY
jgi:hypothetical protein